MRPRPTELAWAAGFFEGEGSIQTALLKAGRDRDVMYPHMRMTCSQKELEPLERMVEILGGKIYGPYEASKGCYTWQVTGAAAEEAISLIEPYLSERRAGQLAAARQKRDAGPVARV